MLFLFVCHLGVLKGVIIQISTNGKLTDEVLVSSIIKQVYPANSILFRQVMDNIMSHVKKGCKVCTCQIKIFYYANDASLISENEGDLQR